MATIRRVLLTAAAAIGFACAADAREAALKGPIEAQVLRVIDGDSFVVRAHIWIGQEIETTIRLRGIDTPELRGRCGAERERAEAARAFLTERIAGRQVALSAIENDKYGGRVLATVLGPDGVDLAEALIAGGHARAYAGGRRDAWCG